MAFPDGWGRKQKITINNTKVSGSGTHSNIIYPVTLDDINAEVVDAGSNSALNGGGDIRFSSDSAGVIQLPCHVIACIPHATPGSRKFLVNVEIPNISTSNDTDFYIWYKKTGESQPVATDIYGRNAVYSTCISAYYLGDSRTVDLTGNGNDLTVNNAPTATTGLFDGGADDFNGSNNYLSSGTSDFNTESIYSIEVLYKHDSNSMDAYACLVAIGGYDTGDGGMTIEREGSTNQWSLTSFPANNSNIDEIISFPSINSWNLVHLCSDRGNTDTSFYWNGSIIGSENTSHTRGNNSAQLRIGAAVTYGDNAAGIIEFIYIYNFYPSADFIATRDELILNHSTFATAGTPEAVSGATTLVVADTSHDHSADNFALTQNITMGINDIAHMQTVESPLLVENIYLMIFNGGHVHSADSSNLIENINLLPDGSTHSQSSPGISITQAHQLETDDASHAQSAGSCNVGEYSILATDNSNHIFSSDTFPIDQVHLLDTNEGHHAQIGENMLLTVASDLVIQTSLHNHVGEGLTLLTETSIQVQSSLHAFLSAGISIGYNVNLVSLNAAHNHFADQLLITQNHVFLIESSEHALTNDSLTIQTMINTAEGVHGHITETPDLSQIHILQELGDYLQHDVDEPFVRIPPGIWGFIGETANNWSTQDEASSSWTEQSEALNDWEEQ